MPDDRNKKPPQAHEDEYRNDPPVKDLPHSGEKRHN